MAHHRIVDQNVWSTQSAHQVKHVLMKNAKIPAKVLVVSTPNVMYKTIFQHVAVKTVILETLSHNVLKLLKDLLQRMTILAIHLHAEQMHNVQTEYAHVCLSTKVILILAVDLNVY